MKYIENFFINNNNPRIAQKDRFHQPPKSEGGRSPEGHGSTSRTREGSWEVGGVGGVGGGSLPHGG